MSSQSYHNELLRIIKQMILDILREWRQPLDRTTGSIPSNQIPPAGTGTNVGGVTFSTATPADVGMTGSAGSTAKANYSDHVHAQLFYSGTPNPVGTPVAVVGTAAPSHGDHVHALTFSGATPANIGTVAVVGTGNAAHGDHAHTFAVVAPSLVLAGPSVVTDPSAVPTFRALVAKDLPVTVARIDTDSLFVAAQTFTVTDAGTITNTDIITLSHDSSGTPGASFGPGLLFDGQDSTTADQNMARLRALWTTATHASRTSALAIQTVNNAGALTEHMRVTGPGAVWIGKTSGGLAGTADLDVAGTVNIDGGLILAAKVANTVFAGPTSGGDATPAFRALVAADIPAAIARVGSDNSFTTLQSFAAGVAVTGTATASVFSQGTADTTRVYSSTAWPITNNTVTAIGFNTERWDDNSLHGTANPTRLTCQRAGDYLIFGGIEWASGAAGRREAFIRVNGATRIADFENGAAPGASDVPRQVIATVYNLAVNDYVELCVFQSSGGALNVNATTNVSPEFGMRRLV